MSGTHRARRGWQISAERLHLRAMESSWDSLVTALLHLHGPKLSPGQMYPVCHGCDRDDRESGDAVWPCRSYTLMACTVLRVGNLESLLRDMRLDVLRDSGGGGRLLS